MKNRLIRCYCLDNVFSLRTAVQLDVVNQDFVIKYHVNCQWKTVFCFTRAWTTIYFEIGYLVLKNIYWRLGNIVDIYTPETLVIVNKLKLCVGCWVWSMFILKMYLSKTRVLWFFTDEKSLLKVFDFRILEQGELILLEIPFARYSRIWITT